MELNFNIMEYLKKQKLIERILKLKTKTPTQEIKLQIQKLQAQL